MDSFSPEIHIRCSGVTLGKDLHTSSFKLQLFFLWTNTWGVGKTKPHTFENIFVFSGFFH